MCRIQSVLLAVAVLVFCWGMPVAVAAPQASSCSSGPSTPVPTAVPTPAPVPAPVPGPGPTSGGAGGATGGGAAGRGGATGGGARGGVNHRAKVKFSRSQVFWMSASKLPWSTRFLPRLQGQDGYAGVEVELDDAIRGMGNQDRWTLEYRPTVLVVYQADEGKHVTLLGEIESDARFSAASRFFNLIKLDWNSIRNKKTRRKLQPSKGPRFFVYDQNRELVCAVRKARSSSLLKYMRPLMDKFYRQSSSACIREMGKLVARRAWVEDRLAAWAPKVLCPDCGKRETKVVKRLAELRSEKLELAGKEKALLEPKPAFAKK